MEFQWLEDCDNMSLSETGSNLLGIKDDLSIGTFKSSAIRDSFNKVSEVFSCDKNTNSNGNASELGRMCIRKEGIDEEVEDNMCLDSTFKKINNNSDNIQTM